MLKTIISPSQLIPIIPLVFEGLAEHAQDIRSVVVQNVHKHIWTDNRSARLKQQILNLWETYPELRTALLEKLVVEAPEVRRSICLAVHMVHVAI